MSRKEKTHHQDPNGVRDLRHAEAKQKNYPPAGVASIYKACKRQTTCYAYDPRLAPPLVWAGKAKPMVFEVGLASLHIHVEG